MVSHKTKFHVVLWLSFFMMSGPHGQSEDGRSIRKTSETTSAPRMEFKEAVHSFGTVQEGQRMIHNFEFNNKGDADLIIEKLQSTCGCTAAAASTGPYRPGESGQIEVNYDSRGKVGSAHKEVRVFSNDPASPHVLTIRGEVIPSSMHPDVRSGETLFKGACAECHAKPAQGKKGQELYEAACFMCHDFPQSTGKPAIAADRHGLSEMSKKSLKKIISKGTSNTSMPGFSEKEGGPLSKEQIGSLVEYLLSLRKEGPRQ